MHSTGFQYLIIIHCWPLESPFFCLPIYLPTEIKRNYFLIIVSNCIMISLIPKIYQMPPVFHMPFPFCRSGQHCMRLSLLFLLEPAESTPRCVLPSVIGSNHYHLVLLNKNCKQWHTYWWWLGYIVLWTVGVFSWFI